MSTQAKALARRSENLNKDAPIALVIGSGFGGLAAAVRMCAKGWRVQVLEKLNAPGGRARAMRVDGYTFDAGPTIITVPFLLEELWNLAGRKLADDVELRSVDPFYRIRFDDGDHFDYSGDPERMRDEVLRIERPVHRGVALAASTDDPYDLETKELYCFLGPHFLVTVHAGPMASVDRVAEQLRRSPDVLARGVERALHAILDDTIDSYFPILQQIDEFIDGLEERVFVKFDETALRDLFHVKRLVLSLRRYLQPSREVEQQQVP